MEINTDEMKGRSEMERRSFTQVLYIFLLGPIPGTLLFLVAAEQGAWTTDRIAVLIILVIWLALGLGWVHSEDML
jgi:hypothetical protein